MLRFLHMLSFPIWKPQLHVWLRKCNIWISRMRRENKSRASIHGLIQRCSQIKMQILDFHFHPCYTNWHESRYICKSINKSIPASSWRAEDEKERVDTWVAGRADVPLRRWVERMPDLTITVAIVTDSQFVLVFHLCRFVWVVKWKWT